MKTANALRSKAQLGVLMLLLPAVVVAATTDVVEPGDHVRVTAERMEYLQDENCMVCEHNVQAVLGSGTALRADKVVAYQGDSENQSDVVRLVATGNVVIKMPERTVYGERGTWDRKTGCVRITGNPVVKQGGHEVTADAIRYEVATGKISFEGRVRAVMQVTDQDKNGLLQVK